MMDNKQIAGLFQLGAQLLALHGENKFKIRSYEQAARNLEGLSEPLSQFDKQALENLPGIGANIAKKIRQILDTGTFDELERLLSRTPEGLLELVQIKGIGPKKTAQVWESLGVLSPEDLLEAIRQGEVAKLKGWGAKSAKQVEEALLFHEQSKGQLILPHADAEAEGLQQYLLATLPVKACEITGPLRRRCPTIDSIDFLMITEYETTAWVDELANSPYLYQWQTGNINIWVSRATGVRVNLYFTTQSQWYQTLLETTGSKAFITSFTNESPQNPTSEADLFKHEGLPWIPPELRELPRQKIDSWEDTVTNLVTYQDLSGCLHNHTTYSDGAHSLYEMAMACQDRGLTYFGVADHSKAAFYANGLQHVEVEQQSEAIRELNHSLAPFRIFHGVEVDILKDGSLDFDKNTLQLLDYVVASVHAPLNMDQDTATKRLLRAVAHPYTTILGHPTGRLLLRRNGYPLDHQKVIDACAENNVIIEINSNPRRLDLDWQWIPYAVEKGVLLSINPDAHNTNGIDDMQYGVDMARKAGAPADKIINTYSRERLNKLFEERKQEAIESFSDTL